MTTHTNAASPTPHNVSPIKINLVTFTGTFASPGPSKSDLIHLFTAGGGVLVPSVEVLRGGAAVINRVVVFGGGGGDGAGGQEAGGERAELARLSEQVGAVYKLEARKLLISLLCIYMIWVAGLSIHIRI